MIIPDITPHCKSKHHCDWKIIDVRGPGGRLIPAQHFPAEETGEERTHSELVTEPGQHPTPLTSDCQAGSICALSSTATALVFK